MNRFLKSNAKMIGAFILGLVLASGLVWAAQTNYLGTVFIADTTTPANQLKVNADGSINANTGAPESSTPAAGTAHAIVSGGTAVTMVTGPVNGCYIVNPLTATDQGIMTAEAAYVNPVTTATTTGNSSTAALQPGQTFYCVPGQTTNVSVNAATSSHALVVVKW